VIMKYYESEIAKKNLWTLVGNAGHSGRSGWTVFACSNVGIVGSNPTRGMDVCVCVDLCIDSGLATSWSPIQGFLPPVTMKKLSNQPVLQYGNELPGKGARGNIYYKHIYVCVMEMFRIIDTVRSLFVCRNTV
jgi:hypothetical protein